MIICILFFISAPINDCWGGEIIMQRLWKQEKNKKTIWKVRNNKIISPKRLCWSFNCWGWGGLMSILRLSTRRVCRAWAPAVHIYISWRYQNVINWLCYLNYFMYEIQVIRNWVLWWSTHIENVQSFWQFVIFNWRCSFVVYNLVRL